MAKLTRNSFFKTHRQAALILYDFDGMRGYKPAPNAKPGAPKNSGRPFLIKAADPSTGKAVPTPNRIICALAKQVLNGDYFVESKLLGTVQALFIADRKEADKLIGTHPSQDVNGKFVRTQTTISLTRTQIMHLAKNLELY